LVLRKLGGTHIWQLLLSLAIWMGFTMALFPAADRSNIKKSIISPISSTSPSVFECLQCVFCFEWVLSCLCEIHCKVLELNTDQTIYLFCCLSRIYFRAHVECILKLAYEETNQTNIEQRRYCMDSNK
jgi:hypothetical protein